LRAPHGRFRGAQCWSGDRGAWILSAPRPKSSTRQRSLAGGAGWEPVFESAQPIRRRASTRDDRRPAIDKTMVPFGAQPCRSFKRLAIGRPDTPTAGTSAPRPIAETPVLHQPLGLAKERHEQLFRFVHRHQHALKGSYCIGRSRCQRTQTGTQREPRGTPLMAGRLFIAVPLFVEACGPRSAPRCASRRTVPD
jgi:hypothetical protein